MIEGKAPEGLVCYPRMNQSVRVISGKLECSYGVAGVNKTAKLSVGRISLFARPMKQLVTCVGHATQGSPSFWNIPKANQRRGHWQQRQGQI